MKRRYPTKMTRKGQITITAEARRETGLKHGDSLDVVVEDGRIVGVERGTSVTERTYGIFKSARPLATGSPEDAWAEAAVERDERTKRGEQSKE